MPLTNFDDLKASVGTWMTRSDQSGMAEDYITLAEARLNRELGPVELDTTLTGIIGSRSLDLSALAMVAPIALFVAETGLDEVELTPKADGTFPYRVDNGYPRFWAIDGTNIDLDCPLQQAYPFRFRYRQRFALSDAADTNWLLTNHPDLYLAATLIWGGVFIRNDATSARWATILADALASVRNIIAQSKRSVLTVDPALVRRPRFNWISGQ